VRVSKFRGLDELPGETASAWRVVRDGEVWTYRVWASPHLLDALLAFPGCRQAVRVEREVVHISALRFLGLYEV
jgi:hypothetical protein